MQVKSNRHFYFLLPEKRKGSEANFGKEVDSQNCFYITVFSEGEKYAK